MLLDKASVNWNPQFRLIGLSETLQPFFLVRFAIARFRDNAPSTSASLFLLKNSMAGTVQLSQQDISSHHDNLSHNTVKRSCSSSQNILERTRSATSASRSLRCFLHPYQSFPWCQKQYAHFISARVCLVGRIGFQLSQRLLTNPCTAQSPALMTLNW